MSKTFDLRLPTLSLAAVATACALLWCATASQAGTLAASPSAAVVNVGDSLQVNISGSAFAETVIGGGFNLSFNPAVLQFDPAGSSMAAAWEFLPSLGSLVPTAPGVMTLSDAAFATFGSGQSGNFAVATLSFQAIGPGQSDLLLSPSALFDLVDRNGAVLAPQMLGSSVSVSAVPEPATWLSLAGGLLWLLGRRRSAPAVAGQP